MSDSKKTAVALKVGDRVEISPSHDLWMRGARFGVVTARVLDSRGGLTVGYQVKLDKRKRHVHVNITDVTATGDRGCSYCGRALTPNDRAFCSACVEGSDLAQQGEES